MAAGPHDPIEELLPAYALNALDAEERQLVERALEREPRYQTLLAGYLEGAAVLSGSHTEVTPSGRLRGRVLGGPDEPEVAAASRRNGALALVPRVLYGVAAALVVALLGVGTFSFVQQQRVDELKDELDSLVADAAETEVKLAAELDSLVAEAADTEAKLQEEMGSLVADVAGTDAKLQEQAELTTLSVLPGVSQAALQSITAPEPLEEEAIGVIYGRPDGRWVLWAMNLEPSPAGSAYHVWLWESEDVVYTVAIFNVDDSGQRLVPMWLPEAESEGSRWISVSVEPEGAPLVPEGEPVLVGLIE